MEDTQDQGTPTRETGRRAGDRQDAGIGAMMWSLTFLNAALISPRRHQWWALAVGLGFGVILARHRAGRREP